MINGSISHSVGRFGLVILFALLLFIAACGGGGGGGGNAGIGEGDAMMDLGDGGNAGTGEGDAMMDFTDETSPEETLLPLLAENGEQFAPIGTASEDVTGLASTEHARVVLAELGDLRTGGGANSPSDSFYEQLLNGVDATGNAGDYKLSVREKNYRHLIGGQQFERSFEIFFVYSYLVAVWGSYNLIFEGEEEPRWGLGIWSPSLIPPAPVPNQGTAIYDLEGRARMSRSDENGNLDVSLINMTGELTADFGENTVGGYLESDYGYNVPVTPLTDPPDVFLDYVPEGITAAKHLGNDRINTPSELSGSLRLDFLQGELIGLDGVYGGARWKNTRFIDDTCATRACFGADVNIYPGMATGDFAGLANARLDGFIENRVGHENGNRWGYVDGQFAGPNEEEVFGRFDVANTFSDDDIPGHRIQGFFVGEKQPEQN